MSMTPPPADPVADPGIRAVHARAAHLAERFVRRHDLAGGERDAAVEPNRRQAAAGPARCRAAPAAEADDGAPWHDPAMPLADRMKLAEGRPLPRRMMAAMAQQDCGQCGYNCKDYADALFDEKEERLNLCVPGGKDTARMLKNLYAETWRSVPPAAKADAAPGAESRSAAVRARPLARQPGLRHVPLAPPPQQAGLAKGNLAYRVRSRRIGLDYVVGDSFGIYPANDPALGRSGDRARSRRRRIFRSADGPCARRSPTACRCRPRRTCCFSSFPISPAAIAGRRRRHWPRARTRTATPRRSTCWRRCKSFPASGPTRKPSSRRSTPATARLFDLVVAEMQSRPRRAHRRRGALRGRKAHPARRRLDFPGGPRFARRQDQGLCAEGAALRAAGRSERCRSS